MTTISSEIIKISELNFSYGNKKIINSANLIINENDFCCIVGDNGSGKTTLLKLIIGLLKPDSGEIKLMGISPEKASPHIGHMPQKINFDSEFPISVLEVVLMGRLQKPFFFRPTSKDLLAARDSLQKVNMLAFEKEQFSVLSGGEQQRVLIARAITSNPKILFFDEPTNSIDSLSETNLQTILKELKGKMTIIMVSHNVRFVSELVEKVICVGKGNISIHKAEAITNQVATELGVEHYKLIKHLHCKHSGESNE